MRIRRTSIEDSESVLALYQLVAQKPGGLARLSNEIDIGYIRGFISQTLTQGIGYVAEDNNEIVGEIHAYSPGLFCFSHILSDLTIAVNSNYQGKGTGRLLFNKFMDSVAQECSIKRVELIARESNQKAIAFYQSLGFKVEGRFEARIQNQDSSFEADIPMAWTRC